MAVAASIGVGSVEGRGWAKSGTEAAVSAGEFSSEVKRSKAETPKNGFDVPEARQALPTQERCLARWEQNLCFAFSRQGLCRRSRTVASGDVRRPIAQPSRAQRPSSTPRVTVWR